LGQEAPKDRYYHQNLFGAKTTKSKIYGSNKKVKYMKISKTTYIKNNTYVDLLHFMKALETSLSHWPSSIQAQGLLRLHLLCISISIFISSASPSISSNVAALLDTGCYLHNMSNVCQVMVAYIYDMLKPYLNELYFYISFSAAATFF